MRTSGIVRVVLGGCLGVAAVGASAAGDPPSKPAEAEATREVARPLRDESQRTEQTITVAGRALSYAAEAGVLVVHVKDPQDEEPPAPGAEHGAPAPAVPSASMSYVAYFLGKGADPRRPITFLFNGGPGSSTLWLHMGAFGPKRVLAGDGSHGPAAPYRLVDNVHTLLADSDLVFVDAPGTGFSHLRGVDKEKAFFGVDQDAHAFANFITEFLSRHGRWNSPKYVFGESYGTTRAAALAYVLQNEKGLDLNGVILLSQILCFDNNADWPQFNPGVDQPYALALPTYAATAWYHHKLPTMPAALEPFLAEVEQFASGEYLGALAAGDRLDPARRGAIVARLHAYTGLPAEYLERADLRINAGVFTKHVLGDAMTAGRLDTRFTGPTIDPLSKEAEYDPQAAAITSAYVSAFNDYVRRDLKFGAGLAYKQGADLDRLWDYSHQPPGAPQKLPQAANVMPDLAAAMKQNPQLKVMMNGGYYDLATPYYAALFELRHLPVPASIAANIEVRLYPSGHMVYANEPALAALVTNVADFIRRTHP
ncbi:MAG: peptidase S10 [Proteobacteria bacterium]|nr:peptidase S10 [Pseudomonadota bacterium]